MASFDQTGELYAAGEEYMRYGAQLDALRRAISRFSEVLRTHAEVTAALLNSGAPAGKLAEYTQDLRAWRWGIEAFTAMPPSTVFRPVPHGASDRVAALGADPVAPTAVAA